MNEETEGQPKFRRQGLGYVYDTEGFRLSISRLKRTSENTSGYLYVEALMENMRGTLVANRFNLDSLTARNSQAKHLSGKTDGMQVNWIDILDRFCLRVAKAESRHDNFTTVGDMEETMRARWLLDNFLLEGQPCTLFAPGGSGKSLFGLAAGLSVQTGKEIIPGFIPRKQGRVAYLDYETVRSDVDARVKALCIGSGLPVTPLGYLRCTDSLGEMIEQIARYVTSEQTALVILDSVEMALASQRESGDANQAIIELYRALRLLDTAVLLIDHVNATEATKTKGTRRPYGSIYKVNLARIAFELRLGGTEGDAANIALYNIKRNDGKLLKPVGLRVEYGDDRVYYARQEITEDSVLADAMSPKDRVYQLLRKHHTMKVHDIGEELGMTDQAVRAVFSDDKGKTFLKMEEKDGKAAIWGLLTNRPDPF